MPRLAMAGVQGVWGGVSPAALAAVAGGGGGSALTYVNSFSMLSGGSPNPTVTYDATGLSAGQWLLVFVLATSGTVPGTFQTSGGTNFNPLATPQLLSNGFYHAVYAVKLISGDISGHSFTTVLPGACYITVAVVDAPGCGTAASYTDWVQLDAGQVFPSHAPITGSIGYYLLALQYSTSPPASGAFVSSPGTIRDDFGPNTTSGSSDANHSSWGSFISPGASGSHTISGNVATSFSGGMIEFGT